MGGGEERLEVGYCRQNGNKYYQNGELMFDFSLQVGDVFVPEKGEPLTVKSIGDTILADGVSRKYLLMVEDMNAEVTPYNSDYWVEGIGSLRMGIYTNDFSGAGLVKILQSCVYNDKTIYRKAPYLVTEGKQWAVCRHSFTGYWTETYRLQGDTVINGKAYKIEHASRNEDLSDMKPSGRYMREEDGRVYSITDKDQRDDFVFDYSMEIGDTLFYDSYFDYYGNEHKHSICLRLIAIRDTIMPNGDGRVRKCYDTEAGHLNNEGIYEFYPDERAFPYSFIEDIGYTDTGLSSSEIGTTGVGYSLLYVKQGDTMLYQQEEGVLWRDNTSVEAIKADKTNTFYYDLQGRPVADPTRGIYIKDGKKAFVSKR